MGLYSIIRKHKQKSREIRLLILGFDNAGKSSCCQRFLHEVRNAPDDHSVKYLQEIQPTFGFKIETVEFEGKHLDIWDVGGQSILRAFWSNYFDTTDGLIFVVDSSDVTRLDSVRIELLELLKTEQLQGASLVILANKQDLSSSLTAERIERILQLETIQSHAFRVVPCSSITGNNIYSAFKGIIQDISQRIHGNQNIGQVL